MDKHTKDFLDSDGLTSPGKPMVEAMKRGKEKSEALDRRDRIDRYACAALTGVLAARPDEDELSPEEMIKLPAMLAIDVIKAVDAAIAAEGNGKDE